MIRDSINVLFLIKLIVFIPIIIVVIVVNYLANSSYVNKLTSDVQATTIAKLLLNNNMEAINAYAPKLMAEEVLIAKYYIGALSKRKDIIVLGSSRSQQIKSVDLLIKPNETFFNSGIIDARLEEIMAIYGMFRKKVIPKIVILELSPWILAKRKLQSRRLYMLKNEYLYLLSCLGFVNHEAFSQKMIIEEAGKHEFFLQKFEKFFSFKLFQLELQKLSGVLWGRGFNLGIDEMIDVILNDWNNFQNLNKNLEVEFEAFIRLLHKDQVRIIFFLAPFHPYLYKKILTPKYEFIFKIQEYFCNFARKNKIEIVGSYNPMLCFCDKNDFKDGIHPRESSTKKIFKNVKI